jgi:hypothetical protein
MQNSLVQVLVNAAGIKSSKTFCPCKLLNVICFFSESNNVKSGAGCPIFNDIVFGILKSVSKNNIQSKQKFCLIQKEKFYFYALN